MSTNLIAPWSLGGRYTFKTGLVNAKGESIASGGNNRAVQGKELEDALRVASAAPELLAVARTAAAIGLHKEMPGEGPCLCSRCEMVNAAKAAIAKASGSQQ